MKISFRLSIVTTAAVACTACVWDEYRAAVNAQSNYEECLEIYHAEPKECAYLQAEANRRSEEYDEAAKEYWECDEETGECDRL